MRTAFFAIDESESQHTKIVSMTGVVVPVESYAEVRDTLYRFVRAQIPDPENVMYGVLPELHGVDLFRKEPWATDAIRLECFAMVVNLVNRLQLKIKRAGYVRSSVTPLLQRDPKLHELNFGNMHWMIQRELADTTIIPVFDGLDSRVGDRLGAFGQGISSMVACGHGESLSIESAHNLCEPLFAPSKYSALVQLADLISYLLQTLDYLDRGITVNSFKAAIQEIAKKFDVGLVDNQVREMRLSGYTN